MARVVGRALCVLALGLSSAPTAPPLAAQTADAGVRPPVPVPTRPSAADAERPETIELDLDRIRQALKRSDSLKLDLPEGTPVFRVDVEGRLPDLRAWLGDPRQLRAGPYAGSPYHQEFLDMVTPPEARASFTNGELAQVLATGLAGGLALRGLLNAISGAIASGRSREACEEVQRTLEALNQERARAGLAPVSLPGC
jgi:hypothetical protein